MHKYLPETIAVILGSASALTCIYFLSRPIDFQTTHTDSSELELIVRYNFTNDSIPDINFLLEQYLNFSNNSELISYQDPFYTNELLRNIARQYNSKSSEDIDTSYFTPEEKIKLAKELSYITRDRYDIDTYLTMEDIIDLLQLNTPPEPKEPKTKTNFKKIFKSNEKLIVAKG